MLSLEYAFIVVLVLVVMWVAYYSYKKKESKKACKTVADCKPDQACVSGYCKSKGS